MTDIRKQIIELIEPYMDKTLNETCLVSSHKWIWYLFYKNNFSEIEYFTNWNHYCLEEYKCRIIWHYDITSVLKCIWKQKILWHYDFDEWYFEFFNDDWTLFCKIKDIPLHLYTEEEDKNLLTLLQELWTKQQ